MLNYLGLWYKLYQSYLTVAQLIFQESFFHSFHAQDHDALGPHNFNSWCHCL